MNNMHVGMVTQDFPPDARGVGYYAYHLSRELLNNGHDVTVFTRGDWTGTVSTSFDEIDVYRVQFLPTYPFHLQLHSLFLNRLLAEQEDKLDVLHLHNPAVPVVSSPLPSVLTAHGTAKVGIQRRANSDVFSLGLRAVSQLFVRNERRLVSRATRVTAVSNDCAAEVATHYDADDVTVLPNGVDTNYFKPSPEEEPLVLYTGALDARKGLFDLLTAAVDVCESNSEVQFVLTGNGPLESKLRSRIHQNGIEDRVDLPGYVDREQLLEYYRRAAVYVNPSYYEGLPTGVLEAMSCGLPVIGTNVNGNAELISEGETGVLVPPNEPEAITEALRTLLDDNRLRIRLGHNARELVERQYDWETIGKKAAQLYSSVL